MASLGRGELILHFVKEDAAEIKARVARQVAEAARKLPRRQGRGGRKGRGPEAAGTDPAPEKKE